jgi:hypothetical protein
MKPTLTLLGFALLSFVSIHCNRSDPVASPTNHFKIEEKITIISSAAFVNLSENRFLNKMKALIFASDGITFGLDDDKKFKLMGKGPLLGLIIYSNNETTLTPGDYFVNLRPPFGEGDIAIGFYTLNWDEREGVVFYEKTDGTALVAGKVTVTEKEGMTSVTFLLTDENGSSLSGLYSGPLQKNFVYKTDQIDF